ncbi:hypothetical protein StrepF001_43995 [Streptomyces sp. F001]|uniref:hypothetical protein n=1 Tax=Streptomyces sp. F001 TaxID=1510026 RepID=UPI00101E31D7|nr:hypothetical protein [Streptomyces sp. F001]RZB13470.1 hypothetical protein StrepF001_43995 [Streptomyces sp. F001]
MSDTAHIFTRRQALGITAGITAGALLVGVPTAAAAPERSAWHGRRTQNHWPVIDDSHTDTFRIEGTGVDVPLLKGDVATVLLYVARRFAYEIDMLRPGDVQGHTAHRTVGADIESNHLSGTAIAIRPLFYPLGAQSGTGLSDLEKVVVADILADCQGVIRWGGHAKPVKESHFQIDVHPGDPGLASLARRIRGEEAGPGSGAGSIDPFLPSRRKKAAAYL